ncbi:unnamed protein product [Citrullus colocynthis]|uniref:Uncharacterized protein n=1 Tax=Citrullus colocynthis TaxID=252529 RepID=A0ABP0YE99_9ROSI
MAVGIGVPICIECGTHSNPCRCKVVGPTLGFLAFAVAAVVEWPVGALVYCFRHQKGRRIMAHPATVVYPSVSNAVNLLYAFKTVPFSSDVCGWVLKIHFTPNTIS